MSDRQIVYVGQIVQDTDELLTNKNMYIGNAKLASAFLGISNTVINGFTCAPTNPASMNISVGPGEIYSLQQIDTTSYGSLPSDSHQILKQGIILDATSISCTAPGTVGYSINYLIQIAFLEQDTGSTVLAYYNATNPAQPYSGPANSGTAQNTIRQDTVRIQAKAGSAAPTGTQTTPSPDSGYVGAFIVTVANGQTTITSGNISNYSPSSFITETLLQKISQATADARYAQQTQIQSGVLISGTDSGSVNTVVTSLSPAITSYINGMTVYIKIANTNTGATTVNINGLGANTIKLQSGSDIEYGNLQAGMVAELAYNGTNFQLVNPYPYLDGLKTRNLIIGGDFQVNPWQRGTSFASVSNGQYTADRFKYLKSGSGVVTISPNSNAPSVTNANVYSAQSLKILVTTASASPGASDSYALNYLMAGPDFGQIAGLPFTISFWVYSSVTGTYGLGLTNYGNDNSYSATYTINNANTWEYKTVTVPKPPISSGTWNFTSFQGIDLRWFLCAGASAVTSSTNSWQSAAIKAPTGQTNLLATLNNAFYIDLIQLEVGVNATAFKFRGTNEEILLCQPYYEKSYSFDASPGAINSTGAQAAIQVASSTSLIFHADFKRSKRSAPTVTYYSTVTGASGKIRDITASSELTVSSILNTGVSNTGYPVLSTSVTATETVYAHWTAESEL